MRLFFGLPLGAAARDAASTYIRTIRIPGKITWVKPECLHVTLRFLGETPLPAVERLRGWESRLKKREPMAVTFGPALAAFPNLKNPKVLYLPVSPHEPLVSLYQELDRCLSECGFPKEDRPYVPHLTMGRVNPKARIAGRISAAPLSKKLEDVLIQVTLFESRLTPAGPIYRSISTANF